MQRASLEGTGRGSGEGGEGRGKGMMGGKVCLWSLNCSQNTQGIVCSPTKGFHFIPSLQQPFMIPLIATGVHHHSTVKRIEPR